MKLICFSHPTYTGLENPILACKSCCMIFLAELKVQQAVKEEAKQDQRQWLIEKVKAARSAASTQDLAKSAGQPK